MEVILHLPRDSQIETVGFSPQTTQAELHTMYSLTKSVSATFFYFGGCVRELTLIVLENKNSFRGFEELICVGVACADRTHCSGHCGLRHSQCH